MGNSSSPYQLRTAPKPTRDSGVLYAFPTEKEHNPYGTLTGEDHAVEEEEEVIREGQEDEEYNPYAGNVEEDSEGIVASEGDIPEEEDEVNPSNSDGSLESSSSSSSSSEESIELAKSGERDWDAEFQLIMAMDPNDIRRHRRIACLADDFQTGIDVHVLRY